MSDATITAEEREMWASTAAARINAVTPERQCEITAQERLVKALNALEQAEARAEKSEAEVARLKLKCGEAAPEGTEIFPCVGSSEYVLCPTCGYEIEDPWDEPNVEINSEGCDGILECRNCAAKIEVHHRIIDFWTAKLAAEEAARRAVADAEIEVKG